MTRIAIAYIRRSKVQEDSPGNISRDVQLTAIRARAGIDGHSDLLVLEDWGKSGRGKKLKARTEYGRLLSLIAEDRVSAVYAYNWSRLGRSTRDLLSLADLAREHETAIITATGQSVDPTTADGRMLLTILTAVDEWQAEVQAERTTAVLAAWREANPDETLGRKVYGEDPDRPEESAAVVLKAFEETGSYLAAASMLTRMGVPTRLGRPWDASSVSRIVRRTTHFRDGHAAVDQSGRVIPFDDKRGNILCPQCKSRTRKGSTARARRIFTGLLKCGTDGSILTSMPRKDASPGYYCKLAHNDKRHPRPYVVAETKIIDWAERELADMRTLVLSRGTLPDAAAIQARLDELDAKRDRIVSMFADGTIERVERDRRLGTLAADRAKVQASLDVSGPQSLALRPSVDWSADPATINDSLRVLWSAIILNGAMLPKRAVWVPTEDYTEEGPQ